MKQIQIADQVRLGPARCLSLTVSGMMYRLFRSMITVAILTLAVTFLSHVLSYSLIEHETRLSAYRRLTDSRQLGQWITQLTSAQTLETIEQNLLAGDSAAMARYERMSSPGDVAGLRDALEQTRRFQAYLDQLPEATRIVLVGAQSVGPVLRELGRPGRLAKFERDLQDLRLPPPDMGTGELTPLVERDMPRMDALAKRIQQGQQQALEQLHQGMGGQTVVQWLAGAPDSPEGLSQLRAAGFDMTGEQLAKISVSAVRRRQLEQLTAAIQIPGVAAAITRRADIAPTRQTLTSISGWLTSRHHADWLSDRLDQAKVRGELTGERLLALAQSVRMEGKWTAAVADTQPRPRAGLFDLPRRTRWLIVLSFLVCAAGVTNAMFMSVTERFAEIATMKCLGALDGFLMMMFLMESALQGAVGAVLGILLGMGLAVGRGTISFGALALGAMPWTDLMWCAALSTLAGMMLAVMSAVGPAWMAARLAPMEAMRID